MPQRHPSIPGAIMGLVRRELARTKQAAPTATPTAFPTIVGSAKTLAPTDPESVTAHNSAADAHGGVQAEVAAARGVYQTVLAHLQAVWDAVGLNTAKRHDRAHALNSSTDHTGRLDLSQLPEVGLSILTGGATFTNGLLTDGAITVGTDAYDAGHQFATPGYLRLTNGFTLQWGVAADPGITHDVTLPIPFENDMFIVLVGQTWSNAGAERSSMFGAKKSNSVITVGHEGISGPLQWLALGY